MELGYYIRRGVYSRGSIRANREPGYYRGRLIGCALHVRLKSAPGIIIRGGEEEPMSKADPVPRDPHRAFL